MKSSQWKQKKSFFLSLGLHILLLALLSINLSFTKKTTLTLAKKNTAPMVKKDEPIVHAVTVNQQAVQAQINRLKAQQNAKANAERQAALRAKQAQQQRVAEQRRLAQLKRQAQALNQKQQQAQRLAQRRLTQLKQQQQAEAKRLQQAKQAAAALAKKRQQEKERLAKLAAAKKKKEAMQRAAAAAKAAALKAEKAKKIRLMGEVNKYQTLILQAIHQQWIPPLKENKGLSSRFRIRLDKDGRVLSAVLVRGSGSSALDLSAQTAIYKASPLPVPSAPDAFALLRDINLTVRP